LTPRFLNHYKREVKDKNDRTLICLLNINVKEQKTLKNERKITLGERLAK